MLLDTYSKATTMLSYYAPIFPELFIVLASFVLLMWGVYHRRQTGFIISVVSILVLLGSALLIARHPPVSQELFNGAFVDDRFGGIRYCPGLAHPWSRYAQWRNAII